MIFLLSLLLPGQFVPSDDFSVQEQKQAFRAAVRIIDWSDRGGRAGTGAIVGRMDQDLYVLTAFHVVDPGKQLEVQCFDLTQYPNPVKSLTEDIEVVAVNRHADLALVRARTSFTPSAYLRIGGQQKLPQKSRVLSVGCDRGEAPTCWVDELKGTRSLARENARVRFWITQTTPVIGRSGGPLVDESGVLIGVCRGFLTETSTLPAEGIYASLEEIHRLMRSAGFLVSTEGDLVAMAEEDKALPVSWSKSQETPHASLAAVTPTQEGPNPSGAD